jgi:ParB family chromosome partitioning protein
MSNASYFENAIFHIEVDKIKPNPYQPRKEFDESALRELADSIRMYGVLQPLVVTRKEFEKEDGGIGVEYELIAGERRLRASKIAGLLQVPAVIRAMEDDSRMKLELAIIENLQREDLNPVDRAVAFKKLAEEFGFKHAEIAKKVGKSRVYVSNTMRLLALPEEILGALSEGKISEGHTRPLLMLDDRPEEQVTLFKEITFKKMSVREAEGVARRIAYDRVRKHTLDPEMVEMEEKLTEALGTRVRIDRKDVGGKITIDFFSNDDIRFILTALKKESDGNRNTHVPLARMAAAGILVDDAESTEDTQDTKEEAEETVVPETPEVFTENDDEITPEETIENSEETLIDDRTKEETTQSHDMSPEEEYAPKEGEKKDDEGDLYSIHNFSV